MTASRTARSHAPMSQQARLGLVLGLNLIMITGLVVVGLASHSLSVLAAGGDYVADSTAIALGILAIQISRHPHGHPKATTVVALINGIVLLVVTAFVIGGGFQRLLGHTPHIEGLPVLVVSAVATLFMAAGALILGRDAGSEDLHMRSVLLDTVSDAVSSAAVAVTGGIIYFADGLYWLDSLIAVLIGLIIGYGALKLLRDVVIALRRKTPLKAD